MAKKNSSLTDHQMIVTPTPPTIAKKTPVKKTLTKKAAPKKTAPKKTTQSKSVVLNDKKVKDLLDTITKLTVDLDYSKLQRSNTEQESARWESKANDLQIEYDSLKKSFNAIEMTRQVLCENVDSLSNELETTKGLLTDAVKKANHANDVLTSKQREIENTNINFVKLNNLYTAASQENENLKKELTALKSKWYHRLFN